MSESLHPIRAYRLWHLPKMSMAEFGERVGMIKETVYKIETGKIALAPEWAKAISDEMGIPLALLCPELAEMFQNGEATTGRSSGR